MRNDEYDVGIPRGKHALDGLSLHGGGGPWRQGGGSAEALWGGSSGGLAILTTLRPPEGKAPPEGLNDYEGVVGCPGWPGCPLPPPLTDKVAYPGSPPRLTKVAIPPGPSLQAGRDVPPHVTWGCFPPSPCIPNCNQDGLRLDCILARLVYPAGKNPSNGK